MKRKKTLPEYEIKESIKTIKNPEMDKIKLARKNLLIIKERRQ